MEEVKKLYYGIGEVAERVGMTPVTIRYWTDLYKLPVKRVKGRGRRYVEDDIRKLEIVKNLIYKVGLTHFGVDKYIQQNGWRYYE